MNTKPGKQKLLVIINAAFISGAELSAIQFLNRLDTNEFDVLVFSNCPAIKNELRNADNFVSFPFIWFVRSYNIFYLLKACTNLLVNSVVLSNVARHEQVDIIYSNSTKSHLYGALVRLLTNKKAIWHIRDNFKKSILSGFLSKNSDTILCVANHLAEKITTREKRVIHGGVNITEWNLPIPDEQNRKQSSKSFEDIIVIAQVAQLTPWKNHLALIEAASILVKEFTNIVFLLIGDDLSNRGNAYKNQLRKKIDELDLSNYFSFVGHRNDIKDVLAQVDILIHPAIGEPFGRVLVEAMALEKPVVAVNSGGPSEIVLDGVTGFLVDPKNLVRGLAQKTRILLKNKDLRIEMGKAGRQRVVSEFSLEKHVEQMEAVFYDISQE